MSKSPSDNVTMESFRMSAEHLEGADECTVEALLSCVQDSVRLAKKPTVYLEDEYASISSPSHSCTTVKPVFKPIMKPESTSYCSTHFPLISSSGVVAIVSPPKLANGLEVIFTNSEDISPSTVHAVLGSPLKFSGQREATYRCSIDSGHTDTENKSTEAFTSCAVHVSKRSLRKQILHPKPDECSEDCGLTDAEDKDILDLTSSGGHVSKQSPQKQAPRSKPVAKHTDSTRSSPEARPTPKPKKRPMPCMRPQKCNVCQKVVCNNEKLKTHMRTHTGEKPYSCPMCPEKFATSNNLNIHKRTHTGEKPYSCKVCERTFSQYQNMRTHMLTHTGEKPHACNFCEKRFAHRLTLRRHLLLHTGE